MLSGRKGAENDKELSLLWDVDALSDVFLSLSRFFFLYAANCNNKLFIEWNVHIKNVCCSIYTFSRPASIFLLRSSSIFKRYIYSSTQVKAF